MRKNYTIYTVLFILCIASRILYKYFSGLNNYILFHSDALRYDQLSTNILNGNYDLDVTAFVIAPLYPFTLALFKWISFSHWEWLTVTFQFILVSVSAIYIYRISYLLWQNKKWALISSLVYIFYPLTMWFNFTLTQETTFQAYFIIFIFYFLLALQNDDGKSLIVSAFFFSLSLLTKSHILILLPPLIIFLWLRMSKYFALHFLICLLIICSPALLKNYLEYKVVALSSYGSGSFFLLGHSDQTYPCLMQQAGDMGQFAVDGCDPSFVFDKDYHFDHYGKVNQLSVKERNAVKWQIGRQWILDNPGKFFRLKLFGMSRAIIPGLDWKQYRPVYFLSNLILGLFIYLFAFYAWWVSRYKTNKLHNLLWLIYLTVAFIFILFFPISRFRVITLEPFLICYATAGFFMLKNRIRMPSIKLR